jgi:hypothetical protein
VDTYLVIHIDINHRASFMYIPPSPRAMTGERSPTSVVESEPKAYLHTPRAVIAILTWKPNHAHTSHDAHFLHPLHGVVRWERRPPAIMGGRP